MTADNQTATTATTIMPTTIDIASTTSAFPFVQRWVAQYENQQLASSGNVNVNYMTDREIIVAEGGSGHSDLAIVGVPDESNNTLYIPVSAQALAIVSISKLSGYTVRPEAQFYHVILHIER